jgi:predicted acyl esterase
VRVLALPLALVAVLVPSVAQADMPSLKASCKRTDALDHDTRNAIQIPYRFCDDGIPPVGGLTPNEGAIRGVPVPQRYAGYAGLPRRVTPDPDSGADSRGFITLDVNVAMPDPRRHPRPRAGYPLIALMHGCCSGSKSDWHGTIDRAGEKWHYTDAWFAARGYVVLSYTARGFVDVDGHGSTGVTQIDHRAYEINDLQYLVGLLAEDPFFGVNPQRIVVSGGSYGGGLSWLALTDPTWRSPRKKIAMKLAAVAPKYGWTDLVSSLIPNGRYRRDELAPSDPAAAVSRSPIGMPKRSFLLALYTSGKTGLPPPGPHATFPPAVDDAFTCFGSTDPFEANPLCASTLGPLIDSFVVDRSAYFQTAFLRRIARDPKARIPVFSAGTFSDQLFPMEEHRRMQALLRSIVPDYPIQEYYGDYNHAVQNKAKEWGDLCDANHHVCRADEYRRGFNLAPEELTRLGVTTRLNRFIDYYARPPGNPKQSRPRHDVTVSLQTCRQNAGGIWPLDQPGERFSANRIEDLAPNLLRLEFDTEERTTSTVAPNQHATQADPVANSVSNGATCPSHSGLADPGVATYDSDPLAGDVTMIGQTRLSADVVGTGNALQMNARLYDLSPDGTQVLVDRGVHRLAQPTGPVVLDLHGNGWRFPAGHRIRLEITQDDDPYVKSSNQPGTLTISNARLAIPIRERAPGDPGESGPTLRMSVKRRSNGRFSVTARSTTGERYGIVSYEFFVGTYRDYQPDYKVLAGPSDSPYRTYHGIPRVRHVFTARATDTRGVSGPLAYITVVAR